MDIDRYKRINDSLGHEVGDEVLREVARRLTKSVREADTASRFGGDEFVVLCEDVGDPQGALAFVERIRAGLQGPVDVGGRLVPVILLDRRGDRRRRRGACTAAELLANADAAMYRAKELGRGRVEIFDAELHRQALARLDAETALRARGRRAAVRARTTSRSWSSPAAGSCGVEALVRWRRPGTEDLVGPTEFIELAEEIGVIGAIGEWVLLTAVAEVGGWAARGLVAAGLRAVGQRLRAPARRSALRRAGRGGAAPAGSDPRIGSGSRSPRPP